MALLRDQKEQLVQEYGKKLQRSQVLIWAQNNGLSVVQLQRLRRSLREADAEAVIVKNTLFRIALKDAGLPVDRPLTAGPSLVTFVYGDIAPAAKVVMDFSRERDSKIVVRGGVVGGKLASAAMVDGLTSLPSREVLLGRVVGGIQAPITGFVYTLSAMLRGVMNVLNARADQLKTAEG